MTPRTCIVDEDRKCPPSRYDCPRAIQGLCPIVNFFERGKKEGSGERHHNDNP